MTEFDGNFEFLKEHSPIFFQLAQNSERYFTSDPNTTLVKLRQLCEALAKDIATRIGIDFDKKNTSQADLLYMLRKDKYVDSQILELFKIIRLDGNTATHEFETSHGDAIKGLRAVRDICIWYHKNFGDNTKNFVISKFQTPRDPSLNLQSLEDKIRNLTAQLSTVNDTVTVKEELAKLEEQKKEEYRELAEIMDEEARKLSSELNIQEELIAKEREAFEQKITELQLQLLENKQMNIKFERPKLTVYQPDEKETRILIDEQLKQAGWLADTERMTQSNGELPEKGKNKAIAEWRTGRDKADYILFIGLTPVATVEAKKQNKNVAGKIGQAERYAKQLTFTDNLIPANKIEKPETTQIGWQTESTTYTIPFVFSCNGRPYFKQLVEQSGVWFRDVRKASNTKKPLEEFYSPEGLINLLEKDIKKAEQDLRNEPFGYLNLRDYQEDAIKAVEHRLEYGQRECLLAMATGTGKTRTIIGLIYRFLKTKRFNRILFLVDRRALGKQAFDTMQEAKLESDKPLSSIYNIANLGDMEIEAVTRVHVATVQALVKRIYHSDNPPTIDQYDCIIIDEAHRGYTLDQEMTEGEVLFRDSNQYISSYRRVLDYFDAVKIGLTATPALHTAEIFNRPVYTYSYREAVADDWLIDYEPPITMETKLSKNGIKIEKGEVISVIDTTTGEVDTVEVADELAFEVSSFNRNVISESFNQVICEELAQNLDPYSEEKTLVFCVTDRHADMVKRLLDEEFIKLYGDDYNEAAVRKITGASDKVDQLISEYKNDKYPNIAITVDLLTTGIDVPPICNIVFLRRVKSRILFEQMIGRATRRCDEIGKTFFRVYDPVKLFETLEDINTMKPLVKKPNVSIQQLVKELITDFEPETIDKPSQEVQPQIDSDNNEQAVAKHKEEALDHLSQKLMQVLRRAKKLSENNDKLKDKLAELEDSWGVAPEQLHQKLKSQGVAETSKFLTNNVSFLAQLEELKVIAGSDRMPIIFEGDDELISVEQNIDEFEKPEDYLESFEQFIKNNLNNSVALNVITNKPRDLTRETLKEVRTLLDNNGYTQAKLQTAWRSKTNQDITASIVGHIRRAALGEPLIPFETRVDNAMQKIYASQSWKPVQKNWLDRIAKQLKHEVIVDRELINTSFREHGGVKQLDSILNNQLDEVISQLNEYLWVA